MALALSLDGTAQRFPDPLQVAEVMAGLGVDLLVPGRSLAAPAADRLRAELLGVRFPAVRAAFCSAAELEGEPRGAGFTSSAESDQRRAVALGVRSLHQAANLRASWLLVEPGPLPRRPGDPDWRRLAEEVDSFLELGETDPALERLRRIRSAADACEDELLGRVCPLLHEVVSHQPGLAIALVTPASPSEWPTARALEHILEDLGGGSRPRVVYWHDTGRARALARRGFEEEEAWLDRLAPHCVGADLTDCAGLWGGLPAGSGEVDFAAVRGALAASAVRAVRAEPYPGPGPMRSAVDFLRGLGF